MLQYPSLENTENYSTANKQASKILCRHKRLHEKEKVKEIVANKHNIKLFFRNCNQVKQGFKPQAKIINKEDGTMVIQDEEIAKKFSNYFEKLLNKPHAQSSEPEMVLTAESYIENLSLEEVQKDIKKLKNNKAPGENLNNAEMIKAGGPTLAKYLHRLIEYIWTNEIIPEEWNVGIICPIYKKRDSWKMNNYTGIALQDVFYKTLANIIHNKLEGYVENLLGDYQCGFCKSKSTIDQIFIFSQTLDTVIREKLWNALRRFGIPRKYINLLRMCNNNMVCKMQILK